MDVTLRYTLLGNQAVSLLDQGEVLDLDETLKHAADETLPGWLKERFGDRIDLSLYQDADTAEVAGRFASLANATSPSDLGIANNGLALIAAYCLEVLQQERRGS